MPSRRFLVRAIATPRPKTREIWYVLDEKMSGDAGKLVLFFFQRETKANGQFGKLKQLGIRPYEVGRLAGRGRRRDSQSPAGLSRRGKP